MQQLATLIPAFPLVSFLYIIFFGKGLGKGLVGWIASISVLLSFAASLAVFTTQLGHNAQPAVVHVFKWIHAGALHADISFLVDPLSTIYLLFVTGVGFLIHVYSIGYMHDDEGFNRFMAYLNLFVFFMLILVLGDTYLLTFVGWEGVGVCSFMLIGFWYKDMANNDAAKKAFIINRIGDLGLLMAMWLIFFYTGTLSYDQLFHHGASNSLSGNELTMACIFLFIGAMGKSAQIPLHTWLPDAMAGPTPVSALIHAATMVTAGIYLVARSSNLFESSETASQVVIFSGILTSLLGATIAMTQNDIKKVLAYSTVSQLGLMFVALGIGAYTIAVFHVITHAFFKALLFLGSGSVIHACSGEQDIRRMGGLRKVMPITHITFLIGTIAISGIPPLAGFFSKDQIIGFAFEHNMVLFVLTLVVSALTPFYMFRLYYLTFHGKFRGTHEQEHHLHESPRVMTMPLVVLSILSVVGGFIGFPHAIGESLHFHHWLDHFLGNTVIAAVSVLDAGAEAVLMVVATLIAVVSIWLAYRKFKIQESLPLEDDEMKPGIFKWVYEKYRIDELYEMIIRKPVDRLSAFFSRWFEPRITDGLVEGTGTFSKWSGHALRYLHSGQIAAYIAATILGLILLLLYII
jgi:NADH-quinone oxidoreductase subunit L